MPEIVKIQYCENHIKVELDSGEKLKLSILSAGNLKLHSGKKITNVEYKHLAEESSRFTCYHQGLSYLAIRSRSRAEMETYLRRKGYSGDIIQETIAKFHDSGYINDRDFAIQYIKSKKHRKTIGENLLRSELYRKGIPKDIIRDSLKETRAGDDDIEAIYELAAKKFEQIRNKTNPRSKLHYFLHQRGFNNDLIRKVLLKIFSSDDFDSGA